MKQKMIFTLALVAVFFIGNTAFALPTYDIWQDTDGDLIKDLYLGSIVAYSGAATTVANMDFYSASIHPINGPTPEAYKSKMFLYNGPDGLGFGFFHNLDNGGTTGYWNHVDWNISLTGMSSSFGLSDDGGTSQSEFRQLDAFNYQGRWAYHDNTDGGLINDLTPTSSYWEIAIDPLAFGDIQNWSISSGDGSSIDLWNSSTAVPTNPGTHYNLATNAYTTYITSSTAIPEPATMLLVGLGMAGMGFIRRKRS